MIFIGIVYKLVHKILLYCKRLTKHSSFGSKNGLFHFTLIPMEKIALVFELFGFQTAFRNGLRSKTKVPLYQKKMTAKFEWAHW